MFSISTISSYDYIYYLQCDILYGYIIIYNVTARIVTLLFTMLHFVWLLY